MADTSRFPGFRFCPTDDELISYYLNRKIEGLEKSVEVISEVDLCKHEPWDLPDKSVIQSDHEWFFFAPRGRKYPNGSQTKRATETGYWKATGKERPVKSASRLSGTKRTLVFHKGRAPEGERTDWIMHEYSIKGKSQDSFVVCRLRTKNGVKGNSLNCKSESQRDLSPTNAGLSSVSLGCSDTKQPQLGLHEEGKDNECCSGKQGSISHSPFIDQIDSTSDSVQDLPDGTCSPQSDSVITQKDWNAEDECFAEIMKEDIIKLDYFSLQETPLQLREVAEKYATERISKHQADTVGSNVLPFQGTAQRRIRLQEHKVGFYRAKKLEVGNEDCAEKVIWGDAKQWLKGTRIRISVWTVKNRLIFTVLLVMALLVLFLLKLREISHHKMFISNIMS
nr:NAC089 [Platanus x hispanica]